MGCVDLSRPSPEVVKIIDAMSENRGGAHLTPRLWLVESKRSQWVPQISVVHNWKWHGTKLPQLHPLLESPSWQISRDPIGHGEVL